MKRLIIMPLSLILLLISGASACTAIYIGSDVSEDGSILIARSNDCQANWPNRLEVTEHVEDQPGRVMPIDNGDTVFAPIPATTYRYVSTPWMDSARVINEMERDAAACANEYGVNMTMSVTAFSNAAALEADPPVPNGLAEMTANDLVVCQSKTAREAVDKLLALIDAYGSNESNIALISDREETWYVEMYTGHQYAAVKLPQDAACVFGNEFSLRYTEDYADSIVSDGLSEIAEAGGFAIRDDAGRLDLADTYSGEGVRTNYPHRRTWIGHKLLAPGSYGEYALRGDYPFSCSFSPRRMDFIIQHKYIKRNSFSENRQDGLSPFRQAGRNTVRLNSAAKHKRSFFILGSRNTTGINEGYIQP